MQTKQFSQKIHLGDKCYLVFSTVITTLLGLVLPFSILIIFDRVLPNQSHDTLFLLFAFILFSIVLDYQVKNQEEKLTSTIMGNFESNLTNNVFRAVCMAEMAKFRLKGTGEYLERIATINEIKMFFAGEVVRAMINTAVCLVTMLLIGIINPWASVVLIIASLVLFIFVLLVSRQKVTGLEDKSNIEGLITSKIIEIISSPLDIKARNMEYRLESLMAEMVSAREEQSIKYEQIESKFNLLLALFQQLAIACVVVVLAVAVINMQASQGVMAAIVMLTNRYFAPFQQVMRTIGQWKLNSVYIERIAELLALNENIQASQQHIKTKSITVRFTQVHSSSRIEFTQGKSYQLYGKSGCGKSHLVNCIAMQQKDENISITINDTPLEQLCYSSWRNSILLIDSNQDFVEGTIIENLTCFSPSLNNIAFSLCQLLGIKTQIDNLPAGFYTELKGHLSAPFSRQTRYALLTVRALLTNKKVVVFDDIDRVYDDTFIEQFLNCISYRARGRIFILISNKIAVDSQLLKLVNLDAYQDIRAKSTAEPEPKLELEEAA